MGKTTKHVSSFSQLSPGDHISEPLFEPFARHHMLVVRVIDDNTLLVIEKGKGKGRGNTVVEREKTYSNPAYSGLVLFVYDSDENCYSAEKAIANARSKLGSKDYDLFKNNCEHFVTWAKTGKGVSAQVDKGPILENLPPPDHPAWVEVWQGEGLYT